MKDSHQMVELSICFINSSLFEEINLFEWCMDWRWVNNEAGCCWPKYWMLSGSTWQGKCKPDRNSASPALSSVSGQQHLSCSNLSLIPFYHWVSGSFSPFSNASPLGFPSWYLTFTQCPQTPLRLSFSFLWNTIFISACLSSLTLIIGWAPAGSEVD